jgi:hypothetical protein
MKKKIIGVLVVMLLIVTSLPIVGTYNIDMTDIENNDRTCIESMDRAFIFVIGDFTETDTQYTGHFSFLLFVGIVDGEFVFITVQDEILVLNKNEIVREIIITSKLIIAITAPAAP